MSKVSILLKRDFKNSLNLRVVFLLMFMILLQNWFIVGSGSITNVTTSGKIGFMDIVFSYNLFGSIVALALAYNYISQERENKIMDLILTSGITKKQVIFSKTINCFAISMFFSLVYTLIIFFEYLIFTKSTGISILCFKYFIPITIFLGIYNVMGLMFSIILRSSRESLIVSVIIGGLFMPRIFMMVIEGIGKALSLSEGTIKIMGMFSPALIMNALSGDEEKRMIFLAIAIFILYISIMIALSLAFFLRQDELNYGE